MKFYLGLAASQAYRLDEAIEKHGLERIPFFISVRELISQRRYQKNQKKLPRGFMLDSGGFNEIRINGSYSFTAKQYADMAAYQEPERCFAMDWMCNPVVLEMTGKTVKEHQELTLLSYLELREMIPNLVCPVLQGWTPDQYVDHLNMYEEAGISLDQFFGLGSVVMKNARGVYWTVKAVRERAPKIRLHGFGVKAGGLSTSYTVHNLETSDSIAWTKSATRIRLGCDGCELHSCSSCLRFAILWRNYINLYISLAMGEYDVYGGPERDQLNLFSSDKLEPIDDSAEALVETKSTLDDELVLIKVGGDEAEEEMIRI